MERLELLDPHNRPSEYRNVNHNIASNNTNDKFLATENEVMSQDETSISISGKLTKLSQHFPNHNQRTRHMFHLQLKSKERPSLSYPYLETFQCYHKIRSDELERLVKLHKC